MTSGWPWRRPRVGQMGEYRYAGWATDFGRMAFCPDCGEEHEDGVSTQVPPDPRVVEQMERLRDHLCTRGWDITWDMLVVDLDDDPMAFLHVFVNGTDMGAEGLRHSNSYGIRVCADELGDDEDGPSPPAVAADCLEAVIAVLPEHVDDLIRHFETYPYGTDTGPS